MNHYRKDWMGVTSEVYPYMNVLLHPCGRKRRYRIVDGKAERQECECERSNRR